VDGVWKTGGRRAEGGGEGREAVEKWAEHERWQVLLALHLEGRCEVGTRSAVRGKGRNFSFKAQASVGSVTVKEQSNTPPRHCGETSLVVATKLCHFRVTTRNLSR